MAGRPQRSGIERSGVPRSGVPRSGVRKAMSRRRPMDRSHTELSVLKHHYQVHNRTEGKSPCTVEWYDEVLGLLLRWLNEEGRSTNLGAIDEMVIREFLLYLKGRPGTKGPTLASSTMYNRVNALKSFFSWLHRQEYTKDNLLAKLKLPKVTQQIIVPLSPEEVAAIFKVMPTNTPWGARDGAIVSLMLDSGVRLSELANLKEADVHLEDQWVKVLGKGSKERMVAFGVACQKTLLHYFFDFRAEPAHQGVDTFFLALDDEPRLGTLRGEAPGQGFGHPAGPLPSAAAYLRHPVSPERGRCVPPQAKPGALDPGYGGELPSHRFSNRSRSESGFFSPGPDGPQRSPPVPRLKSRRYSGGQRRRVPAKTRALAEEAYHWAPPVRPSRCRFCRGAYPAERSNSSTFSRVTAWEPHTRATPRRITRSRLGLVCSPPSSRRR